MREFWIVDSHFGQWGLAWAACLERYYKILNTREKLSKEGYKDRYKDLGEEREGVEVRRSVGYKVLVGYKVSCQ